MTATAPPQTRVSLERQPRVPAESRCLQTGTRDMTTTQLLGNVGFIGAGAVGATLARAMHRCGYSVRGVASRTAAPAEHLAAEIPGCDAVSPQDVADRCDTVFLTVPDDAIDTVAAALRWRYGQAVVHCSGALPLDVPVAGHRVWLTCRRDAPAADLHGWR